MNTLATLGVVAAVGHNTMFVRRGWRTVAQRTPVEFDDWTVDGVPLRELLTEVRPVNERTLMDRPISFPEWTRASLRALLNDESLPDDPWVTYKDGRVGILFCELCIDLDCATLSAGIEFSNESVIWRDIAFQVGYQPFVASAVPLTIEFDRQAYEALIRSLLLAS